MKWLISTLNFMRQYVNEGPFADYTGAIEEIDVEKKKVSVLVDMFGRETPVELDFHQIEKL